MALISNRQSLCKSLMLALMSLVLSANVAVAAGTSGPAWFDDQGHVDIALQPDQRATSLQTHFRLKANTSENPTDHDWLIAAQTSWPLGIAEHVECECQCSKQTLANRNYEARGPPFFPAF